MFVCEGGKEGGKKGEKGRGRAEQRKTHVGPGSLWGIFLGL
jgi:hypothetical protein